MFLDAFYFLYSDLATCLIHDSVMMCINLAVGADIQHPKGGDGLTLSSFGTCKYAMSMPVIFFQCPVAYKSVLIQ